MSDENPGEQLRRRRHDGWPGDLLTGDRDVRCPMCGIGDLHPVTPALALAVLALTDPQLELLHLIAVESGWDCQCWACDGCDEVFTGPKW